MRAGQVSGGRFCCLLAGAILLAGWATGVSLAQGDKGKPDDKPMPEKKEEGTIAFSMDAKPWPAVFQWLADQTNKEIIAGPYKPQGSFTFVGPSKKKYTIPEVIDIINAGLLANTQTQKFVLINNAKQFILVAADERIDSVNVMAVAPEDLEKHGDTEIVRMTMALKTAVAEDIAPVIKQMKGPFGEVYALPIVNRLVIVDTVGNLKPVRKILQEMDDPKNADAEQMEHICKFIRPHEAERILREQLGDPAVTFANAFQTALNAPGGPGAGDTTVTGMGFPGGGRGGRGAGGAFPGGDPTAGGAFPGGGRGAFPGADPTAGGGPGGLVINGLGGPGGMTFTPGTPGTPGGGGGRGRGGAGQQFTAGGRPIKPHFISVDERTNKIIVNGPADKVTLARAIMKRIDIPVTPDQGENSIGELTLKQYAVDGGNAPEVARILQQRFPNMTIVSSGNNMILVYGSVSDHAAIKKHGLPEPVSTQVTLRIETGAGDPKDLADALKVLFGDPTKGGVPTIGVTADGLIVRGSKSQCDEIQAAVNTMTGQTTEPGKATSNMRIINVKEGSASAIADQMSKILPKLRGNPVELIGPNGLPQIKPPDLGPMKQPEAGPPMMKKVIDPDQSRGEVRKLGDRLVAQVGNGQLVDPQAKPNTDKPADKTGAPVTIAVVGNKIFIKSDDPFALALATEMYRLMTTSGGEGDFEPIPLKFANAGEIAKLFDQWFNGNKPATPQQNPFQNFFPGRGANTNQFNFTPPTDPKPDRIRIVADPTSNTLLVKASAVDLITIRSMLQILDTGTVSGGPSEHVIPVKNASASDIVTVLKDVYREELNPLTANTGGGGGRIGNIIAASQSSGSTVRLSVGVDPTGNNIIVNCAEPLYLKIVRLVEKLDKAALDNTYITKVVPLGDMDPYVLQQAIAAFKGQSLPPAGSNQPGANQGQGMGNGGRGQGGGFPGGGGGGFPGGGGGGFPGGGGRGGGGGFPGGGGGRGGPGGGGGRGMGPTGQRSGEPDFFGDRVKDDPQPSIFFDPQQSVTASEDQMNSGSPVGRSQPAAEETKQVRYEQPLSPARPASGQPAGGQAPGDEVPVPPGAFNVETIPEAGVIVLRARTAEEMAALIRLIDFIRRSVPKSNVQIEVLPLKFADATSVINIMNQVYSRINLTAAGNGTSIITLGSTQTQGPFGNISQTQSRPASIVLIPVVRQNAILIAAPAAQMDGLKKFISQFDVAPGKDGAGSTKTFHLENSSAAHASQMITQFWSTRYGTQEPQTQNQIRVTFDDNSNTLIVQAAPADMAEIEGLLLLIDNPENNHVNTILRIRRLQFANSDDLAQLLQTAINNEVGPTNPLPAAPTAGGTVGGGVGGAVGGATGATGVTGGTPRTGSTTTNQPQGVQTKTTPLKFVTDKNGILTSGFLVDVHFTSDPRTNSLLIAAPAKTMELIWKLIDEMDVLPTLRANLKVIPIRKADAATIANTLQSLFGATSTTTGTTGARPPGTPTAPSTGSTTGATSQTRPLLPGPDPAPGAGLIDLRINIDDRTNSLIIVGSPGEIEVISAIVARLDTDYEMRHMQVYHLKNSPAVDMANALNSFLTQEFTYNTANNLSTGYQTVMQQVTIVAEPITNKLLIAATDRYFAKLVELLESLDAEQPQVVIKVLIAEVDLANTDEFGVEIGLQSPVIFKRGILPSPFDATGTTISYAASTTPPSVLTPGASVTGTTNPTAFPGFNFNQPGIFPGFNPQIAAPTVGFQGLSSLGVGRTSSTSNIGGLVFSASSDTFNLLVRALKTQNRIDLLSRPQVMTLDNQTSRIFVGQLFPITSGSSVTATGIVTSSVTPTAVGVQLQVTPRISPDGKVILRVTPEVSNAFTTTVSLGNGVFATAINQQIVDTTVIAGDGETVVLGGLITKKDDKTENKVPWLGELPGIGALFRYRTQDKNKQELLVIMTPHIVRSRLEANRVLGEESQRIDMIMKDVLQIHGPAGMEPVLQARGILPRDRVPFGGSGAPGAPGGICAPCGPNESVVIPPMVHPQMNPGLNAVPPPPAPGEIPMPRHLPGDQSQQGQPAYPGAPVSQNVPAAPGSFDPNAFASQQPNVGVGYQGNLSQDSNYGPAPHRTTVTAPLIPVAPPAQPAAAPQGKESGRWHLFNW